ncbi:MAG: DUF6580 family putative transport protein [Terriglobales bacterium]
MLILLFVLGAVGMRFLPHWWDFTPVIAMLLLAGCYMKSKNLWVPLIALMASEFALNLWVYHAPGGLDQYFTWGSYLLVLGLALVLLKGKIKIPRLLGTTFLCSTLFFLVTNFGVWLTGLMYPHTWSGLVTCYAMGVPFYRTAAAGDLFYACALFALYAACQAGIEHWQRARFRIPA